MKTNRSNKKVFFPNKAVDGRREKIIFLIEIGFLIAAGLLFSFSFLGHFVVPNSDFLSFLSTGKSWLHFQIPNSMKRAPVYSIITALAGLPFSRPDRYLLGAEVYNALMLPVVMILIYLNCRKIKLAGAVWIALLAGISPWVVRLSSEPLAELTILAFFAATILFVRDNIKLAYLFAALASITRWDMVGLIPAVALADLLQNRKWRKTIIRSVTASIPFILCMIITAVQLLKSKAEGGGGHYLQVLGQDRTFRLLEDLRLYWEGIMSFLNVQLGHRDWTGETVAFDTMNSAIFWITASLLLVTFMAGAAFAFIRKQWEIIVMLITAVPYILIHAVYPYRLSRFCVPVQWGIFLVAAYGLQIVYRKLFAENKRKVLRIILSITVGIVFVFWAVKIGEGFLLARRICPPISLASIVTLILALVSFVVIEIIRKSALSARWLLVPVFLFMAVLSSGSNIGLRMNNKADVNFKKLAEWFLENAEENDKMVTTMPGFMPIFTGLPEDRFIHSGSFSREDANDFAEYIQKCKEGGVTLIAWDSRIAKIGDLYYEIWGLDRTEVLAAPVLGMKVDMIGRCKLIHMISDGEPKIAIYRIMP
ncbi:MAG: hypothetical protein JXA96_09685 [Sedimentisphaerales bacterium]|nr:hypothetical protein [Sedimentisphaerales bacterium]